MDYFNKLPQINYNGFFCRNIVAKAELTEKTKKNKSLFLDYTIEDDMRADNLSHFYYDSPDYTWLIYMANDYVDPYYDYYLDDATFEKYIIKKYGSLELANSKISHWRTNWRTAPDSISIGEYDSLSPLLKSYYSPVLDVTLNVHSYERRKKDLSRKTNVVLEITLDRDYNLDTKEEDVLSTESAKFSFLSSYDNKVVVNNLIGTIQDNQEMSNGFTVISSRIISSAISQQESHLWEPVSYYDLEYEKNEAKRTVRLIDNEQKNIVKNELERVFRA